MQAGLGVLSSVRNVHPRPEAEAEEVTTLRVPAVFFATVVGAALAVTACSSGSGSAHQSETTTSTSHPKSGFAAGPNPCVLVTQRDILTALKEQMVKESGTNGQCVYKNPATGDYFTISTAATTPAAAKNSVTSAAATARVKVQSLQGVGDSAIAYQTTSASGDVATSVIAKNGTIIFMYGSRATSPLPGVIALASIAARRA
jgi:hypothetical protein